MSSRSRGPLTVGVFALGVGLQALMSLSLSAQVTDRDLEAIASWVAVDAATGYERRVAPALAAALGGWTADAYGNVVTTVGTGSPHRIVACALDRPSYAVSQIRDDGYLRLHRIGGGSPTPVVGPAVRGAAGARADDHRARRRRRCQVERTLRAQHASETAVVTADDLWLDVGAESRADVEALGIALLDPVGAPPAALADRRRRRGPDAGRRTGCAAVVAVAAAARRGGMQGRTTFVLSAQEVHGMGRSVVARGARRAADQVTVLAPGEDARADSERPARELDRFGGGARGIRSEDGAVAGAIGRAGGLAHGDRARGRGGVVARCRGDGCGSGRCSRVTRWVAAPPPAAVADRPRGRARSARSRRSSPISSSATRCRGTSGPSAVPCSRRSRPGRASARSWTTSATSWSRRDRRATATVFMAHMDEVGYVIESIAPDGTVTLAGRGAPWRPPGKARPRSCISIRQGAPSTVTGQGNDIDPRWKAQFARRNGAAAAPWRVPDSIRGTAEESRCDAGVVWSGRGQACGARRRGRHAGDESQGGAAARAARATRPAPLTIAPGPRRSSARSTRSIPTGCPAG